jgi:PAS domain-containing protein
MVMMEDLTQYNTLKSELERNNKMLKTVIDSIPSLIWLKDGEGRYLFTNKAFDEFNSFLGQDPIGKTDYDLWPTEQAEKFTAEDVSVRECEYPLEKVDAILHPTYGTKHYRTLKIGVCCGNNKELIGTVGVSCDVSKQFEQDQILADAIEQLTASLNGNVYVR